MPPSRKETPSASERRYAWGVCGLLVLAVWLIYGQTFHFGFLDWDDSGFIYANPHVNHGLTLDGIQWAFTEGPYGEWYPLAPLSHMLDCQLFGLDAPWHHLTSLLLHAAVSIGLFLVIWRMTAELWPSAFVAALMAIHPQHVESVAWLAERRDVLSGLFFVFTLAAYVSYVGHDRSPGRYCLVVAMLTLGLMAKPMLVTVPPLLLLLDYWPLGRFGSAAGCPQWTRSLKRVGVMSLLVEKLPLFALAAADCLLTLRTHNHPGVALAWSVRIGNAAVSAVKYLVQSFYPVDLVAFYPLPEGGQPVWKVAGAVAILVIVSAAAVVWRRRCPYLFVGWFWYLGMLAPVLGLVGVSDHAMADRYMYLPSIGLYIALTWGATRLFAGAPNGRGLLVIAGGAAIVILIALADLQTALWADELSLWAHVLACYPNCAKAETALADALVRDRQIDEAAQYYRRAQQHATDATPFNKLGTLRRNQGHVDEAIEQFHLAIAKEPESYLAYVNLGAALAQQRHYDQAIHELEHALQLNPRAAIAYITWAHLLVAQGKPDDARSKLDRAIEVDPYSAEAHCDLGATLMLQQRTDEAIRQYEAALGINPNLVLAHYNLALVLAQQERTDEAIAHLRRVVQLDPDDADARRELERLRGMKQSRN